MREIYKALVCASIALAILIVTTSFNFTTALPKQIGNCDGASPEVGTTFEVNKSGIIFDEGLSPDTTPESGDVPEQEPCRPYTPEATSFLPQVTGLVVSSKSSTRVNLAWNPISDPELSQYNIYLGTSSGFSVTPGVTIPTGTSTAGTSVSNSYSSTGLNPSTKYYYRVAAVDQAGTISPLSSEISVKTNTRSQDLISGTTAQLSSDSSRTTVTPDVLPPVNDVSEAKPNESSTTTSKTSNESANQTSNNSKETNTTSMLNTKLIPKNQLLTQEDSNVTQGIAKIVPPKYKIKVTFDSITIHDDHEGLLSGDGEFDLSAYVQGKRVDLTGGTRYSCTRLGQQSWCERLWDAKEGKTYQFNPGTEVTVDLPGTATLLIFTVGEEVDGQGRLTWPADDGYKKLLDWLQDPLRDRESKITNLNSFRTFVYVDSHLKNCGTLAEFFTGLMQCDNTNDDVGDIQVFYDAPNYGEGSHEEKAHLNDYTLRYTISVSPPPLRVTPERLTGDIPGVKLEEESTCINNLPVSSVTSSGNQPTYPPANAIDNNLNTKWWSTIIVDPFITLDLGAPKSICGADIAWSDGNTHPYKFDISASTDGTSFTKVFSGTSSGTASSPEKYSIPLTQARYVKITITESTPGATRSIAEISEIDLFS